MIRQGTLQNPTLPDQKTFSKNVQFASKPIDDFIIALEDIANKVLMYIKYSCCFPVLQKEVKKRKKKRISFNIEGRSNTSRISLKEEEIFTPLTFDCLEVPESPVVDPFLGYYGKVTMKDKLKNLFLKRKRSEATDIATTRVDKCCGQGISIKKTEKEVPPDNNLLSESRTKKILKWLTQLNSEKESDLEESHCGEGKSSSYINSSMSEVTELEEVPYVGGDGPQNNDYTNVKRRSKFFNEIYSSNGFDIID